MSVLVILVAALAIDLCVGATRPVSRFYFTHRDCEIGVLQETAETTLLGNLTRRGSSECVLKSFGVGAASTLMTPFSSDFPVPNVGRLLRQSTFSLWFNVSGPLDDRVAEISFLGAPHSFALAFDSLQFACNSSDPDTKERFFVSQSLAPGILHLAVTIDGTRIQWYFNHRLVQEFNASDAFLDTKAPGFISLFTSDHYTFFSFELFDRVLSDDEIAAMHESPSVPVRLSVANSTLRQPFGSSFLLTMPYFWFDSLLHNQVFFRLMKALRVSIPRVTTLPQWRVLSIEDGARLLADRRPIAGGASFPLKAVLTYQGPPSGFRSSLLLGLDFLNETLVSELLFETPSECDFGGRSIAFETPFLAAFDFEVPSNRLKDYLVRFSGPQSVGIQSLRPDGRFLTSHAFRLPIALSASNASECAEEHLMSFTFLYHLEDDAGLVGPEYEVSVCVLCPLSCSWNEALGNQKATQVFAYQCTASPNLTPILVIERLPQFGRLVCDGKECRTGESLPVDVKLEYTPETAFFNVHERVVLPEREESFAFSVRAAGVFRRFSRLVFVQNIVEPPIMYSSRQLLPLRTKPAGTLQLKSYTSFSTQFALEDPDAYLYSSYLLNATVSQVLLDNTFPWNNGSCATANLTTSRSSLIAQAPLPCLQLFLSGLRGTFLTSGGLVSVMVTRRDGRSATSAINLIEIKQPVPFSITIHWALIGVIVVGVIAFVLILRACWSRRKLNLAFKAYEKGMAECESDLLDSDEEEVTILL